MTVDMKYRPDIDGLRAIAVSSVVAFHGGLSFMSGGFAGVDIFFVISGFLITSIIYGDCKGEKFSVAVFYARRAKRILPALIVLIFVCYLLAYFILTTREMKLFSLTAGSSLLGVSNIVFWWTTDYFAPAAEQKPLLMTWSLGVEEQFYLFFPITLYLMHRFLRRAVLPIVVATTILSFALAVWTTARYPTSAFFLIPTRAWELGIGSILAIVRADHPGWSEPRGQIANDLLASIGALLVGASLVLYDAHVPFPGVAAAMPVLGTALLIVTRTSLFNRVVLSARPVVFVGLVSYSWYLWHWPLLSFSRVASTRDLGPAASAVIIGLSFVAAVLSWRFVERPFRNSRRPTAPTLLRYGVAVGVAVVPAVVLNVDPVWLHRLPQAYVEQERADIAPGRKVNLFGNASDRCLVGDHATAPRPTAPCVSEGHTPGGVAVWGDSHAASLAHGVRLLAEEKGIAFRQTTKSSCPPLIGVLRRMPDHPLHAAECGAFDRRVVETIVADPAIETVVLAAYWSAALSGVDRYVPEDRASEAVSIEESSGNLLVGLQNGIDRLLAAGKKVVLVKDTPIFDFHPVRRMASMQIPFRRLLDRALNGAPAFDGDVAPWADVAVDVESRRVIDDLVRSRPQVTVVEPREILCGDEGCRYASSGRLLFSDPHHLGPYGSKWVVERMNLPALR